MRRFLWMISLLAAVIFPRAAVAGPLPPCMKSVGTSLPVTGRTVHQRVNDCLNKITLGRFQAGLDELAARYRATVESVGEKTYLTRYRDRRGETKFVLWEQAAGEFVRHRILYRGNRPDPQAAILSYHLELSDVSTVESLSPTASSKDAFFSNRWRKTESYFDSFYRLGLYDYDNVFSFRILNDNLSVHETIQYRLGVNWGRVYAEFSTAGERGREETTFWTLVPTRVRIGSAVIAPEGDPSKPVRWEYLDGVGDPMALKDFFQEVRTEVLDPLFDGPYPRIRAAVDEHLRAALPEVFNGGRSRPATPASVQ